MAESLFGFANREVNGSCWLFEGSNDPELISTGRWKNTDKYFEHSILIGEGGTPNLTKHWGGVGFLYLLPLAGPCKQGLVLGEGGHEGGKGGGGAEGALVGNDALVLLRHNGAGLGRVVGQL